MLHFLQPTFENIEDISGLLSDLGYESQHLRECLNIYLSNQNYGVMLVTDNQAPAGLIAWSVTNLFVSKKRRFHVEALVVSKTHRGRGIGKLLLQYIEKIAQEQAPAIIDLTSGKRREKDGVHEFYKRCGYGNDGYMAKNYFRKEFN